MHVLNSFLEVEEMEPGVFVIIIPQVSAPVRAPYCINLHRGLLMHVQISFALRLSLAQREHRSKPSWNNQALDTCALLACLNFTAWPWLLRRCRNQCRARGDRFGFHCGFCRQIGGHGQAIIGTPDQPISVNGTVEQASLVPER